MSISICKEDTVVQIEDTAEITFVAGTFWEPRVVPIGLLRITGNCIVVTNVSTVQEWPEALYSGDSVTLRSSDNIVIGV